MPTIFVVILRETAQSPNIFNDPNAIGLMGVGIGIAAIIIGTIVAILVGIYQVRQGRIRRKLEYRLLSNGPIVAINSTVANQVEIDIRVKGVPVKDAHLLVLLIKNNGKVSIHNTDYFETLTFEFDTTVLSASVLETVPPALINPKDISTFLTLTPQSVQFPAFPLNPNDTVQINILLERKGEMKVRGRLDQGNIISFDPRESVSPTLVAIAAIAIAAIAAIAAVLAVLLPPGAVLAVLLPPGAAAAGVLSVGVAIRTFSYHSYKN